MGAGVSNGGGGRALFQKVLALVRTAFLRPQFRSGRCVRRRKFAHFKAYFPNQHFLKQCPFGGGIARFAGLCYTFPQILRQQF